MVLPLSGPCPERRIKRPAHTMEGKGGTEDAKPSFYGYQGLGRRGCCRFDGRLRLVWLAGGGMGLPDAGGLAGGQRRRRETGRVEQQKASGGCLA